MVREAEKFAAEDKKVKERIDAHTATTVCLRSRTNPLPLDAHSSQVKDRIDARNGLEQYLYM